MCPLRVGRKNQPKLSANCMVRGLGTRVNTGELAWSSRTEHTEMH